MGVTAQFDDVPQVQPVVGARQPWGGRCPGPRLTLGRGWSLQTRPPGCLPQRQPLEADGREPVWPRDSGRQWACTRVTREGVC